MPAMKDEVDRSSLLSLRQWITVEGPNSRDAVLRKTAVARGLALILRHIARTGIGRYGQNDKHVDPIFAALHQHVLGLKSRSLADDAHVDNFTLEIIDGRPVVLSCVSPSVNLVLEAGDTENAILPRHESLESWTIDLRTSPTDVSHPPTTGMSNEDSDALLTKLGDLLYKLYSGNPNLCATTAKEVNPIAFQRLNVDDDVVGGHHRQKRRSTAVTMLGQFGERHAQLKDLGVPDVTACLVRDLLEVSLGDFRPDTSVASIEEVCEELQLMHEKSGIFMFASPIVEQPRLEIDTTVLYGREDEMSRLLSVHDRLRDTGESEAILIDGYSGCGKTSLARSVIPHVERAGGYFIGQKLDVLTSSPVALVLNAFDMLPPLVLKMCNPCEVESIKRDLCSIFGDQLASLVRLLPNAALLRTSTWSSPPSASQLDGKLRVDYTLQLFARIISSRQRPIVLHLDDIQHTDQYSLDLLQHILCDIKGCSSILFVGSFRSNELGDEHPVNGFMRKLDRNGTLTSNIHLGGIKLESINALVSNSLRLVPRYCKDLSREIYRRTDGNPLFAIETLRSFAERGLLEYRLRQYRWCWDIDRIGDVKLSDNVSDLITLKIAALPEKNRQALKALSCFGSSANHDILNTLSMELENLQLGCFDELVNSGLLNKNDAGYNFSHDKVLEAAVNLFTTGSERACFHRDIGRVLLDAFDKGNLECVGIVADQCNHGFTSGTPEACTKMAILNEKAAASALKKADEKSALHYSRNAMRHLSKNCWESERDLSIRVHLTHAKSAAINGVMDEAKDAIDKLLPYANAIDKMAALSLKGSILASSRQIQEALATIVGVLSDLGETIPQTFDDETLELLFAQTLQSIRENSISEVRKFKLASPNDEAVPIIRFYDMAVHLSHLLHTNMLDIFACKSVMASMKVGWTKCSCFSLAVFGSRALVRGLVDESLTIGFSALKLMERFSDADDQKTFVYGVYYGTIANFNTPFQLCCERLNHGKEIGLLHGDNLGAIWNGNYFLHKGLLAAIELSKLQKECKYQESIVEGDRDQYFGMTVAYTDLIKNTLDILTGDEPFSGPIDGDWPCPGTNVIRYEFIKKYHHSVRAFWTRNFIQCFDQTRFLEDMYKNLPNTMMIQFYGALAGYCLSENETENRLIDVAIAVMREKETNCAHNFHNKRLLLEAEKLSHEGKIEEAEAAYLSAIEASRKARFVHEEGLVCELAAAHYLRNYTEDVRHRGLLQQALECYKTWGCKPRVEHVVKMIDN
mmetsp:Transcript_14638/g.32181  ORF Transcript_14638/g.32181 Transcript_14638/m.32181 type:complete len:1260 (-) Transcript_14638:9-3788(-)